MSLRGVVVAGTESSRFPVLRLCEMHDLSPPHNTTWERTRAGEMYQMHTLRVKIVAGRMTYVT